MSIKIYFALFFSLITANIAAQQTIKAGQMICHASIIGDSIDIQLQAPTSGWLGIGFNHQDNIVHSDLIQLRVRAGRVEAEDQYITGLGQHPTDLSLGGQDNVRILSGQENQNGTQVHFRIPFDSGDSYDFSHHLQKEFWIILAYSVDDDFQHHSIMRKHFQIMWE